MKKNCFLLIIIFSLCVIVQLSPAQENQQKQAPAKIAFCQYDGSYWQIWTMDLDGSNKKQLTSSNVDKRSPSFSSDGQKIAYTTNEGELWVMESDGTNNTHVPLTVSAREPKWCFDDTKIIFTSYRGLYFLDDSDIWTVNIDGSGLEKIIRRPSLQFLPTVSQDNKEILFVDVLEISSHEIFSYNLERDDFRQITSNSYHDTAPVFSPDSQQIVYACDKDGQYDIWIMDRFGQDPTNLTNHPAFDSSPLFTSDGKTIFFLSDRKNGTQIWRMDINGENLTQITKDKYDKQDISIYSLKHEKN